MSLNLENMVANLAQKVERQFYGKYRGFVVENADPEQLGRLKVRVPSVLGNDVVTGWALPCVPYGGAANQGFLFIPEVDAGVWVEFEAGDLEFPVWVGTFWCKPGGESELPMPNNPDGEQQVAVQDPPTRKIITTVKGHTLQLEDLDDEELIMLKEGKNGHVITMNKAGITITDGKNKHVVELNGDGITITDGANGHSIVLEQGGIAITDGKTSGNTMTMESSGITVQTSGTEILLSSSGVQVGGSGATEPFVLGNQFITQMTSLLTQLGTHTHVGNLGAPTSPPVVPLQFQASQILSTKHKVEK